LLENKTAIFIATYLLKNILAIHTSISYKHILLPKIYETQHLIKKNP